MEINLETLKILRNNLVINWVRKFNCENVKANGDLKEMGKNLGFETKEMSVGFLEPTNVKCFVTDAKVTLKAHTLISLSQIAEVIRTLDKESLENATLIVGDVAEKPVLVRINKKEQNDLFVIAPKSTSDDNVGSKNYKKDEKQDKECQKENTQDQNKNEEE